MHKLSHTEIAQLMGIALALAAKHLEQTQGQTPTDWVDKFTGEAVRMLESGSVQADELEELMAIAFNKGQKL